VSPRVALAAALACAVGCDRGPRPPSPVDLRPRAGAVVARVGDLALTDVDVAAVARERSITPRAALDLLVRDGLLAAAARRSGVAGPVELADDAWRARIQALLARDIEARFSAESVPASRVEEGLEARRGELAHRGLRRVVHAVWIVPPDAGAGPDAEALARMRAFRDALSAATGGHPTEAQFREAGARIGDPATVRVEDLSAFDRQGRTQGAASYVLAFAQGVWAIDPAAPLSQPFASPFGVHVALLLEEVPPMTRTDDEARAIVRGDLALRARVEGVRALLAGLRRRKRVELRETALQQVERLARRSE
jgi:hypothetical protein